MELLEPMELTLMDKLLPESVQPAILHVRQVHQMVVAVMPCCGLCYSKTHHASAGALVEYFFRRVDLMVSLNQGADRVAAAIVEYIALVDECRAEARLERPGAPPKETLVDYFNLMSAHCDDCWYQLAFFKDGTLPRKPEPGHQATVVAAQRKLFADRHEAEIAAAPNRDAYLDLERARWIPKALLTRAEIEKNAPSRK